MLPPVGGCTDNASNRVAPSVPAVPRKWAVVCGVVFPARGSNHECHSTYLPIATVRLYDLCFSKPRLKKWCFGTPANLSVVQSCRGRPVSGPPKTATPPRTDRSADRTVPRLKLRGRGERLQVRPDHRPLGRVFIRPSWLILPVAYACLKV